MGADFKSDKLFPTCSAALQRYQSKSDIFDESLPVILSVQYIHNNVSEMW